jgi:hypothetical protein
MGFSISDIPSNMGAAEYYGMLQNELTAMNKNWAAASAGADMLQKSAHAGKMAEVSNIASGAYINDNTNIAQHAQVGRARASMSVGEIEGTLEATDKFGLEALRDSKKDMTAKGLASMVGYGESVNTEQAMAYGELSGKAQARGDKGTYEGAVVKGIDNYLKGVENQSAQKASSTATYGKETTLREAIDSGITQDEKMAGVTQEGKQLLDTMGSELIRSTAKTNALAKDKTEIINAATLTSQFGENLDQIGSYTREVLTEEGKKLFDSKQKEIDLKQKEIDSLKSNDMSESEKNRVAALENEIKGLNQAKSNIRSKYTESVTEKTSFDEMIADESFSKLASRIGSSKAYEDIGFDTVASNAQYGTLSQALKTAEKVQQQGGIENAVKIDVAEAGLKAASQQYSTQEQMREIGKSLGMDSDQIKKAMEEGGDLAARKIKDAFGALQGTMAGAKTRSDISSVNAAGSPEEFKEISARKAAAQTGALKETIDTADGQYKGGYEQFLKDQATIQTQKSAGDIAGLMNMSVEDRKAWIQKARDKVRHEKGEEKAKEFDDSLRKARLLDEKGNILAENWVSGMAYLRANNMNSHNALVAAGMTISGAVGGSDPTVKIDALNSSEWGSKIQYSQKASFNTMNPLDREMMKLAKG